MFSCILRRGRHPRASASCSPSRATSPLARKRFRVGLRVLPLRYFFLPFFFAPFLAAFLAAFFLATVHPPLKVRRLICLALHLAASINHHVPQSRPYLSRTSTRDWCAQPATFHLSPPGHTRPTFQLLGKQFPYKRLLSQHCYHNKLSLSSACAANRQEEIAQSRKTFCARCLAARSPP